VAVVSDLMFVAQSLSAGGASEKVGNRVSTPEISSDFETPWYLRFSCGSAEGLWRGWHRSWLRIA
jgi:hypothetical protein